MEVEVAVVVGSRYMQEKRGKRRNLFPRQNNLLESPIHISLWKSLEIADTQIDFQTCRKKIKHFFVVTE